MQLKRSFFNPTVLKKDITRFFPLWALYSVCVGLVLLMIADSYRSPAEFAASAPRIFQVMGVVNLLYAGLTALTLFGDLFQSRMCNALHAMPLHREGWFLTHFTAGMLFSLVPNIIASLLCCIMLQQYAYLAFVWLGIMFLQYLCFFGIAVFSVQCAGNRLGAVAVFGIVNFLSVIAGCLMDAFYTPLLYGIRFDLADFARYSPGVNFCAGDYIDIEYDNLLEVSRFQGFLWEQWRFLFIAAALGGVLAVLAAVLYRNRSLESAGDFIAWRPAAPVFLVIYTLGVGMVLYAIGDLFGAGLRYFFLLIGFAIGFFTGKMLLEKRVRVFGGKAFASLGILVAVFALTLGLTALDPVGLTRYVPEIGKVESVTIRNGHRQYQWGVLRDELTLTEEKSVDAVLNIHKNCTLDRLPDSASTSPLYICYQLKNGQTVERYYYVSDTSQDAKTLRGMFSSFDAVFGADSAESLLEDLGRLDFYGEEDLPSLALIPMEEMDDEELKHLQESGFLVCPSESSGGKEIAINLFQALKKDCAEGNMAQGDFSTGEVLGILEMRVHTENGLIYRDVRIYSTSVHTLSYLKSLPLELYVTDIIPQEEPEDILQTGDVVIRH